MNSKQITIIINRLEKEGVKFYDKTRVDIRGSLTCGKNVEIDINNIFIGSVLIGDNVKIGPNCIINNCSISSETEIRDFSSIENSRIGKNCIIGPYARIRPETVINNYVQVGNFVEIKNSCIGDHSRINHLSFVGDSTLEENVTFGAGTITCNHDGIKHNTLTVRKDAYIGSGCNLIAPLEIGKNATVGSGSTITKNVLPNALTICRVKEQVIIKNWSGPKNIKG